MTGNELRERIDRLGLTYTQAARQLGLTSGGLHHQMRSERKVTLQTELLLERLEAEKLAQCSHQGEASSLSSRG